MVSTGGNTGKTVAIILGGAAGVGFIVICLLFARNLMKKHDGTYMWWSLRWIFFFCFSGPNADMVGMCYFMQIFDRRWVGSKEAKVLLR